MAIVDCSKVQEELLHRFPATDLEPAVEEHLAHCHECRRIRVEMMTLGDAMGSDEDFYPDTYQAHLVQEQVEKAIERPRITKLNLYRPVAIAASVVLIVSVSLISLMMSGNDSSKIMSPMLVADSVEYLSTQVASGELDQSTLEEVFRDFTSNYGYQASDLLLDDISEEELQYLEDNFDVKDLL